MTPPNDSIDAAVDRVINIIRYEISMLRTELSDRLDKIENFEQAVLLEKITQAKEEGRIEGRFQNLEAWKASSEKWKLATVAPGIVALAVMLLNFITKR